MLPKSLLLAFFSGLALAVPALTFADIVCPDFSYCTVAFTNHDRITIAPFNGACFVCRGILIDVYVKDRSGAPLVGLPAQDVVITNPALCICPGGNSADAATDANGRTTFRGTIVGGGCVESLDIIADGVRICTIPVKTSSPDLLPSSPCHVDAADLSHIASLLGRPDRYDVCADLNQSGPPTIDAADLSHFAVSFQSQCR